MSQLRHFLRPEVLMVVVVELTVANLIMFTEREILLQRVTIAMGLLNEELFCNIYQVLFGA